MMTRPVLTMMALALASLGADEGNLKIDYQRFLVMSAELEEVRSDHRVSEAEFLRMAAEPGTVILDTRSKAKFEKLHVKGAVHLNFADFTAKALGRLIPDRNTRILIYCNNNFDGEPDLFPGKRAEVALNIPTFLNLYAYGYRNVYELKPLLDVNTTRVPFAGTRAERGRGVEPAEAGREWQEPL